MKRRIAMLVLVMGMCWGLADRATTQALAMPQDDKMQSGDKMKDDKMAGDKMAKKKSKMHKKDKMNKMDKKESKDKMDQPKS